MKFHSTSGQSKNINLPEAVMLGLAPDGGLFMPNRMPKLPASFFNHLNQTNFNKIAFEVSRQFISEIPDKELKRIIREAFNFPLPLKQLDDNLYVLELFHGPTLAFKDFGARFLARLLGYFAGQIGEPINIITATSGDTGSAVASGFLGVKNIQAYVLYPSKRVSPLQEKQLTTFGKNITAIEVKGSFDDCQALAKSALGKSVSKSGIKISSANSINFGRLVPQSFYYIYAVAELRRQGVKQPPIFVVPSGNFGNLTAGIMAKKMGLPVDCFVAATNRNSAVPQYLTSGIFKKRKSCPTLSNAMDVVNPSNFDRLLEMYKNKYKLMNKEISGLAVSDTETKKTIASVYKRFNYIIDPHTAVGITVAQKYKTSPASPVVVLGTAHPAKFKDIVDACIKKSISLPSQLSRVARKKKHSIVIPNSLSSLMRVIK